VRLGGVRHGALVGKYALYLGVARLVHVWGDYA
jgi:hypothetical protein